MKCVLTKEDKEYIIKHTEISSKYLANKYGVSVPYIYIIRKRYEMRQTKAGYLSDKDKEFIDRNHNKLTCREIADELNKTYDHIYKYMKFKEIPILYECTNVLDDWSKQVLIKLSWDDDVVGLTNMIQCHLMAECTGSEPKWNTIYRDIVYFRAKECER